jgi:tRNA threonylcarbamoyladenosine biosynthesis protein TsaB
MHLLALDTATRNCAVALFGPSGLSAEICRETDSHSRSLFEYMDELLDQAGCKPSDLSAVAVGVGPGSFTGVRIGMTVAKTMAYGLGIPLVGISSLEALAKNGFGLAETVCPALDALKDEVFCARYRVGDAGFESLAAPEARSPDALAGELKQGGGRVAVLGSGFLRYRSLFEDALGDRLVALGEASLHLISAAALGELALVRLERGELDDPAALEPTYCRLSEAELSRGNRSAGENEDSD